MTEKSYPLAAGRPAAWNCGSHSVQDPYLYMTDAQDPQVLEWVAAENAYTGQWFQGRGLEDRVNYLKNKRSKPGYHGISEQGGMLFASRSGVDGKNSAVLLNQQFEVVRVLLDGEMLDGRMQVYGVSPCPGNNTLAAFGALKNGAARMTVVVRDLEKNETLAELDGTFAFTWSRDGKYLYSTTAEQRPDGTTANSVIRWHPGAAEPEKLYTWPGHAAFLRLDAAPDGGLFVEACPNYHDTAIVYLNEAGQSTVVFAENGASTNYIGTIGSRHYFFTDENAPLGKVVAVEHSRMGQAPVTVIPESREPLEHAMEAGGKLLLEYLQDAACSVGLWDGDGKFLYELKLPTEMGSVTLGGSLGGYAPESGSIYMGFESFTCPASILKFTPATGAVELAYCTGEGPREDLAVERQFVDARDGQRVLAFLVYKKGLTPNGKIPTLMYGYGGYASSQLPWYSNPFVGLDIPDWADRGGLYVHCIIRGGNEYGAAWHDAGCGKNKKNVFYDFIDIARQIMAQGWTSPAHTAICGGSNGGLLVTALLTIEPELWGCAIASVPHTDMLHFCCDDRGPMYVTEYGDPREEEMFSYMESYSPYHNIRKGVRYPAVYVQTGEMDNNVPPYHGKKFAAALQQATAGGPVLLRVLPYGSHDRGAGEYFYRTAAEMQVFMETSLGMRRED